VSGRSPDERSEIRGPPRRATPHFASRKASYLLHAKMNRITARSVCGPPLCRGESERRYAKMQVVHADYQIPVIIFELMDVSIYTHARQVSEFPFQVLALIVFVDVFAMAPTATRTRRPRLSYSYESERMIWPAGLW
jgi:hypothetical protein